MPAEQIRYTLVNVLIKTRSAALHICDTQDFYFWRMPEHDAANTSSSASPLVGNNLCCGF